ncbi:hypothetical protein BDW22DRAFT_1362171 [Trametopsis cervina]|nr:hypothetical protein BDW22DRAFT_1362171 [Trametopsis cervina]
MAAKTPLELPGFYWDEDRQRYFPITARARQPHGWQPGGPTATASGLSTQQRSVSSLVKDDERVRTTRPAKKRPLNRTVSQYPPHIPETYAGRERAKHYLLSENIASVSKGGFLHAIDFPCSSFHVSPTDGDDVVLTTGDSSGSLQTTHINPHTFVRSSSTRELYLSSSITALCYSDTVRLAVSFGPSPKIAVENSGRDADLWTIMSFPRHQCYDIRAADLSRHSLALGAATRGVLVPDIETSWTETLHTGSDVFAICQKDHLVYTGSRNGSLKAFDKRRLDTTGKGQELFGERFKKDTRSITHLSMLDDWQMLVSTIRGDIELHDLRFAREDTPFMEFKGHVNSYSTKLGIAISPCQSLLFAAGQDSRIRAWSLRSGQPLSPSPALSERETSREHLDTSNLLACTFPQPVVALQVTDDRSTGLRSMERPSGMTLWAASGNDIYRYGLGWQIDLHAG